MTDTRLSRLKRIPDDGTSGLWSIKRRGGIAIVQEPNQARFESMPRTALAYVEVDHHLPATEIGALVGRLVQEPSIPNSSASHRKPKRRAPAVCLPP